MDTSRKDLLGELAAEASLERSDFLVQASAQLRRFLEGNSDRIAAIGGVVLIDDEVDYLAIAPDLSFRSRSRYLDEATGKWVSETEVIESPSELVELYNLADVFAAFGEATVASGTEDAEDGEGAEPEEGAEAPAASGDNPYAAAADDWAAGHEYEEPPETEEEAAERLYDLALAFQERSQQTEAHLLEQFEAAAAQYSALLGDLIIVDDEDERLTLKASGSFAAEVIPEAEAESGQWRQLEGPDAIVEFYDPTDVFGDLADTLGEAFPSLTESDADEDGEGEEESEDAEDAEDAEDSEPGEEAQDEDGDGAPR